MFTFMDWVAYRRGRYGCSSPSTKVLHDDGRLWLELVKTSEKHR